MMGLALKIFHLDSFELARPFFTLVEQVFVIIPTWNTITEIANLNQQSSCPPMLSCQSLFEMMEHAKKVHLLPGAIDIAYFQAA